MIIGGRPHRHLPGLKRPALLTLGPAALFYNFGFFRRVMNNVLTESVMEATDLPRAVASSTYSGVRFVGGAVRPLWPG